MHLMISRHLKSTGIAILATKRYYFGVGGGIASFESILEKNYSTLPMKLEYVESYEDGVSNVRDIIVIRKI